MPTCGSQSGFDCSGEQNDDCMSTGQLNNGSATGQFEWNPPSRCLGNKIQTDYDLEMATHAHDSGNEAYDEVANEKRWWPTSHFTKLPEALIDKEGCKQGGFEPVGSHVEYLVEQASWGANTKYDFEFTNPIPDGDPNDNDTVIDDILRLALPAIGTGVGGAYGNAAGAFIASYIPDGDSDPVDLDRGTYDNGSRQSWHWRILMDGDASDGKETLPQTPCDSTGIEVRMKDLSGAGTDHTTTIWSRYDIGIPTYGDGCRCDIPTYVVKTTGRAHNVCTWTSVA